MDQTSIQENTAAFEWVDDPERFGGLLAGLRTAPYLALDTEFVRERTYRAVPGLIQLGDGDQVWLVDPIALETAQACWDRFGALLADPDIVKIVHSAGEDLELLHQITGQVPARLHDTQIAAALAGHPLQMRYEDLARELLGLEFPGGLGRNDWTRRPLPEAWLRYASHDVVALPALYRTLTDRLRQLGRLHWLEEACERQLDRIRRPPHPVMRIKGAAGLDDDALARLARMAEWRESCACERNVPRGFIAADALLLELARNPDTDIDQFVRRQKLRRPAREPLRTRLVELAHSRPPEFRRPPELVPLTPEQRTRIRELQTWVRRRADELGVEAAVLASRRDLVRLVQGAGDDWLGGWRSEALAGLPL
ncbi:MAG: ribonuclease D [Wenzhouxiangellaceae bacterium]